MAAIADGLPSRATKASTISAIATSPVQIMNLRLVVVGRRVQALPSPAGRAPPAQRPSPEQTLKVFFDGDWHDVPLLSARGAARRTTASPAPASSCRTTCTACVPPGFGATVDGSGNIVLERAE